MSAPMQAAAPVLSYRDLRVWQQAMDLVEATYRATKQFPAAERYGLVTQLRRAAVSVASNIAEGHARSLGDYLRHLLVSSGRGTGAARRAGRHARAQRHAVRGGAARRGDVRRDGPVAGSRGATGDVGPGPPGDEGGSDGGVEVRIGVRG